MTLAIGVLVTAVRHHFFRHQPASPTTAAAPAPVPAQTPETSAQTHLAYPENIGLNPYEIEYFIDQNPQANLDPLWRRLKITTDEPPIGVNIPCSNCKAESFAYNLDDDAEEEVVLRIAEEVRDSYTYLVFKVRSHEDIKLLGVIDAHGKYRPSRHFVILSGGKAWLVIESQGANGSGLAAYIQTVYEVSPRGVKPLVSFFSDVWQSGWAPDGALFPSKSFVGRIVSCESKDGVATATVVYDIEYFSNGRNGTSLFRKQQRAVLIGPVAHGTTHLDVSRSTITYHEFETVFNFDSMGDEEFIKYNLTELKTIASGDDANKKEWLKKYLASCPNSNIKRVLLAMANQPQK